MQERVDICRGTMKGGAEKDKYVVRKLEWIWQAMKQQGWGHSSPIKRIWSLTLNNFSNIVFGENNLCKLKQMPWWLTNKIYPKTYGPTKIKSDFKVAVIKHGIVTPVIVANYFLLLRNNKARGKCQRLQMERRIVRSAIHKGGIKGNQARKATGRTSSECQPKLQLTSRAFCDTQQSKVVAETELETQVGNFFIYRII